MQGICCHEYFELDKGFLTGDSITCALHLSRFDLETGEPLDPPAVLPLADDPASARTAGRCLTCRGTRAGQRVGQIQWAEVPSRLDRALAREHSIEEVGRPDASRLRPLDSPGRCRSRRHPFWGHATGAVLDEEGAADRGPASRWSTAASEGPDMRRRLVAVVVMRANSRVVVQRDQSQASQDPCSDGSNQPTSRSSARTVGVAHLLDDREAGLLAVRRMPTFSRQHLRFDQLQVLVARDADEAPQQLRAETLALPWVPTRTANSAVGWACALEEPPTATMRRCPSASVLGDQRHLALVVVEADPDQSSWAVRSDSRGARSTGRTRWPPRQLAWKRTINGSSSGRMGRMEAAAVLGGPLLHVLPRIGRIASRGRLPP